MWKPCVIILTLGITPALAQQPQRPDQQAANRGYNEGYNRDFSGKGPSPGCSNCSTQRAYEASRRGGNTQRSINDNRSPDRCPSCAYGADRADGGGDIGNTGGFNGPNGSNFN